LGNIFLLLFRKRLHYSKHLQDRDKCLFSGNGRKAGVIERGDLKLGIAMLHFLQILSSTSSFSMLQACILCLAIRHILQQMRVAMQSAIPDISEKLKKRRQQIKPRIKITSKPGSLTYALFLSNYSPASHFSHPSLLNVVLLFLSLFVLLFHLIPSGHYPDIVCPSIIDPISKIAVNMPISISVG
jgi:hypothetical protein